MDFADVVLYALTLALFFFGARLARSAYREGHTLSRLRHAGVTVDGQVTSKKVRGSGRSAPTFFIECDYTYDGHDYATTLPVSTSSSETWDVGTSVRLVCLPDDPYEARLPRTVKTNATFFLTAIPAGGLLICGLVLVVLIVSFHILPW